METGVAKSPSSLHQALSNLNRKQATHRETCSGGAACLSPTSSKFKKPVKQYKLKSKLSKSKSGKSLLKCCSNLKHSGPLKRLMYYENENWNDLPIDLVASVKNQVKNGATKVEIDGQDFLLDFLHMMWIDLSTGFQQPIAWIDEHGKCFFPETFTSDDDLDEHHNPQTIKLELEIALDDSECSKMKESIGESDDHVDSSCAKISDHEVKNECLNENVVRDIFMKGMSSLKNAEIVEICKGLSTLLKAHLELFAKQMKITEAYRGDANVRYAWFPSSKEEVPNILKYGIGCIGACKSKPIYGFGVHLFPANCMPSCEKYCDIDENGMKYIVFCRVIMGKMEVIECGLKQMHPSSEEYDNGVDDLQNPRCFVVWNMNKTTHVYPEYVVTFKVSSDAEGLPVGEKNEDISRINNCGQGLQKQLQLNCIPADLGNACDVQLPAGIPQEAAESTRSISKRTPTHLPLPFSLLFSAISNSIAPKEMEKIMMNYESLKNKSMSRLEFIKSLRFIAGDDVLRPAIADIQSKKETKAESNLDDQNQDKKGV